MTLSAGTRLGPYEILSPLGAGGMGEVYRARDPRLGRDVAIKVLPAYYSEDPDRLRRFEQEARAAGALNHPNITAVHDFGRHEGAPYVVQELLEGETLRAALASGPLPPRKVVDYGGQLARGLAAAHEKGIVHRDLKPENVFVTKDGRIKILDFGLAKLTDTGDGTSRTEALTAAAATEAGVVVGTYGYMSPEQVRGQVADARSDIFALGAILYEMLSGTRAFGGRSPGEMMSAILTTHPPDLSSTRSDVPPDLDRIVLHCLEKSPEQRFQSASDIAFALQSGGRGGEGVPSFRKGGRARRLWFAAAVLAVLLAGILLWGRTFHRARGDGVAGGPIRSVAVLPLTSYSADPEQEFFADSMTDAIITDLAKIGDLRVVSRTSAMRYKKTPKSVADIARELGVDALVEGSVGRSPGRVRITAQLIRASTDQHVWADSYERDLKDVLLLQDEVARSIAREIQVKLTPLDRERLKSPRAVDPAAYELYLKGRYFWTKRTPDSIAKAIDLFGKAIDADPTYAGAYAGLAACYMSLGFSFDVGSLPPNEAIPKAKAAAAKALEIDDSLAEVHNPLAFIKLNYDWEFPAAESEFKRALELNPGYADAHHWYAHYLIATGQADRSLAESLRSLELDPLSPIINSHLGWLYYYLRRYDLALGQLVKTLELDPNYGLAHWYVGLVEEQQGRFGESLEAMGRAADLLKGNLVVRADRAHALAMARRMPEAEEELRNLLELAKSRYVNPVEIALVNIGLGRTDEAFRWLERGRQERSDLLVYLNVDPRLDPIRADPRFASLVAAVGLPK